MGEERGVAIKGNPKTFHTDRYFEILKTKFWFMNREDLWRIFGKGGKGVSPGEGDSVFLADPDS